MPDENKASRAIHGPSDEQEGGWGGPESAGIADEAIEVLGRRLGELTVVSGLLCRGCELEVAAATDSSIAGRDRDASIRGSDDDDGETSSTPGQAKRPKRQAVAKTKVRKGGQKGSSERSLQFRLFC